MKVFILLSSVFWPSLGGIVTLQSPRVTNWGGWHPMVHCPNDTYAASMQIKVEGTHPDNDDTALNAVKLFCQEIKSTASFDTSRPIMSGEGPWGNWQGIKFCPKGQVIIGFALRSEPPDGDDTAANNFAMYCGYAFGARDTKHRVQGDGMEWGGWTSDQLCPEDHVVCGIQSQIEGRQGDGDDTSLNNINLDCCELTDVSCTPGFQLVTLETYDNTQGAGEMTASYKTKTSFTHISGEARALSNYEKNIVYKRIGGSLSVLGLQINGEMSSYHEKITESSLKSMISDTISNENERSFKIKIPPKTQAVIKQLYLTCDGYRIGLAKTINQQTQ